MSDLVDEIRAAYARFGIELETPVTYGTYYRLRCARCGVMVGNVGDKLLPGMIGALLEENFDLYAAGLLGCACGHQAERARALDPARADAARQRLG
ncbi:MAG TPA: hypothetical protein VGW35_05095 [Methylomirabilota bacterium]|jgi:hypothetical protein|nr:hypothetical protein [Methylomirabilota bacterium]